MARSPRSRILLSIVALLLGTLAVPLALSGPASAGPTPHMRGGGWIAVENPTTRPDARATFGVQVRALGGPDTFEGHFEYHDHATGLRIRLDEIVDFEARGNVATFTGIGTVGGDVRSCRVTATDNDARGRAALKIKQPDTLKIDCPSDPSFSGYSAGGPVHGNITIEDPNT